MMSGNLLYLECARLPVSCRFLYLEQFLSGWWCLSPPDLEDSIPSTLFLNTYFIFIAFKSTTNSTEAFIFLTEFLLCIFSIRLYTPPAYGLVFLSHCLHHVALNKERLAD